MNDEAIISGLLLSPLVAAIRLPVMVAEARGGTDIGVETMKAVMEKTSAAVEGLIGAQLSMFGSAATFWTSVATGRNPAALMQQAVHETLQAALEPTSKRVRANYRRLSRPKKRK